MFKVDHDKTAERLKALRIGAGETVIDLAKALGVSHVSISYYEKGIRRPSDEVKVKYAEHFGKSIEFLFYSAK